MGSLAHHPQWYEQAFNALSALDRLPAHGPEVVAQRPTTQAATASRRALVALEKIGGAIPAPRVLPTAHHGVQFEWRGGQRELEIVLGPDGEGEFVLATGDEISEGLLDASNADQIAALLAWVLAR